MLRCIQVVTARTGKHGACVHAALDTGPAAEAGILFHVDEGVEIMPPLQVWRGPGWRRESGPELTVQFPPGTTSLTRARVVFRR